MDRKHSERREHYAKNGYVILRQLFRPERLHCLAQTLRCALPTVQDDIDTRSVESDVLSAEAADHKFVYNAAQSVGSSAAAYSILGGEHTLDSITDVTGYEETCIHVLPMYLIIQLPGDDRFDYGWHQDGAYYPWADQMTTLWFPVNRATNAETGTISVIPGSHTDKIRGSQTSFRNGYFKQIITELKEAEPQSEQMLDMEPGDCCLMDGSLVHRSVPNRADSPRVAGVVRMINVPMHTPYERDRFYCVHKS